MLELLHNGNGNGSGTGFVAKFLIKGVILTGFINPLWAINDIDDFVNSHCENVCNGESTQLATGTGLDLWQNSFEYPTKDSETSDSNSEDPYGNVGFKI